MHPIHAHAPTPCHFSAKYPLRGKAAALRLRSGPFAGRDRRHAAAFQPEPDRGVLPALYKKKMSLAAIPAAESERLAAELRPVFPQFQPAASVFETSLNATNPILHAPLDLFSLARIDKGESYYLYADGATPVSVGYIEKIDAERMAVIRTMGIHGQSCLEIVNDAWSASYTDLLEGLLDVKAYKTSMGPPSTHYRHFTEDLPYGICPIQKLGRRYGVPTPYTDAILTIYALALDLDIAASAPDFSTLDPAALL